MNNDKKQLPFNPPAGSLDLEYSHAKPHSAPYTAVSRHGMRIQCTSCQSTTCIPFDATMQAWELLLTLVAGALNVSRRSLLSVGGRRPSAPLHQARACLVQALYKVAEPSAAQRWLKLQGMPLRRCRALQKVKLDSAAERVLKALPFAVQVGQPPTIDGAQPEA
jgi:hypothetical protein